MLAVRETALRVNEVALNRDLLPIGPAPHGRETAILRRAGEVRYRSPVSAMGSAAVHMCDENIGRRDSGNHRPGSRLPTPPAALSYHEPLDRDQAPGDVSVYGASGCMRRKVE